MDEGDPGTTLSLEISQFEGDCPESPADDDSEGMILDAVERVHERSPSNSSATAEDDALSGGLSPKRSDLFCEMVDGKMAIAFSPMFILYRNINHCCTDFKVIFSANCVRINGSAAYGNKETFSIELAVEDVVGIESEWCGRVEQAAVTIKLISKDSAPVDDIHGTSGIDKLLFLASDSRWYDKVEKIVSLNVRYKDLWRVMLDTDAELGALLDQKATPVPRKHVPEFYFEEVIYPEGDPDAVSISMRDVFMLKPDTFINDTIIDFYIKYLKNEILPEEKRNRFHFFNCFFFRKLADMDKDPSSAFEGRAAFLRVRKWTRKVNLFEKDFIFIPVNYNYHWSLIVICHPGEIANGKEDAEKLARVPCILHMDSLKGSHTNLKGLIQSYLWEEWKERQKGTSEDISSRFLNLRFLPLELPQQQNMYDCGFFLLHYAECFLEDAPANFSPFMITKSESSNFLKDNWFPPDEPFTKRSAIIRLIYELVKKRDQPPSGGSEKYCPADNLTAKNDSENSSEHAAMRLSPLKDGRGLLPLSDFGQGIKVDLLQASSFKSSPHGSGSGLILTESFEPTSSTAVLHDAQYQAFGRTSFNVIKSCLPPVEEESEADIRIVHTTSTETGFQHLDVNTPDSSALLYVSKDHISASHQRFSPEEIHNDVDSIPARSTCIPDDPSVQIAQGCPVGTTSSDDKADHPLPVSAGNMEGLKSCCGPSETGDAACSQKPVQMVDHRGDTDPPISCLNDQPDHYDDADPALTCLRNPPEFSIQTEDSVEQENDAQLDADDLRSQCDVHPAKKIRLMCPLEMEAEPSTPLPDHGSASVS